MVGKRDNYVENSRQAGATREEQITRPSAPRKRKPTRLLPYLILGILLIGAGVLGYLLLAAPNSGASEAIYLDTDTRTKSPVVPPPTYNGQINGPSPSPATEIPEDIQEATDEPEYATTRKSTSEPVPAVTPEPDPSSMMLTQGVTSSVIRDIQARLMELGYMERDEPTDYFGPITKTAIQLFQRKHGLKVDGYVGAGTYSALMSDEAKKYSVSTGEKGTDVKELQIRLRQLGYLDKATEYFGTETEAAVKKFQEVNDLTVDGSVGEKTREMLYSEEAKANYFERGEVSEKLRAYQSTLKQLGYLTSEADGKYGDDTEAAVRRFQERSGLIADGYLGPQTIEYLTDKNAQANALMLGMKGDDIEKVQKRLKQLNYLSSVDGYFGSKTENAVRSFQKTNALTVDGKVGKLTLSVLMSLEAKKASSTSSISGSGNSSGNSGSEGSTGSEDSGNNDAVAIPDGTGVETFIAYAMSKLGNKYILGAKGPDRFDCSGFVYWCLNQAGVKQGYMTSATWQKVTKYQRIPNMKDLVRGDVISYKGHVGIYLGDGKMIDASSSQGKVRIAQNIHSSNYWTKNFVSGFRIF